MTNFEEELSPSDSSDIESGGDEYESGLDDVMSNINFNESDLNKE
jgi:hypothetical protein